MRSVLVGIDAGGSSTRARALCEGTVVHNGRGGPGNPATVDHAAMRSSFTAALAGCPEPSRVLACVAGGGNSARRAQVRDVLTELCPGADIGVVADYHAAHRAVGADVCVIAGTGSVICSREADDRWVLDGGKGWILGDHGSAARLGQELLAWYVDDPSSVPDAAAEALCKILGTSDWRGVVSVIHSSPAPAAALGAVAPVLTNLAESGHERAIALVERQLSELAHATIRHALRRQTPRPLNVGLVGGVWSSPAAVGAFRRALASRPDLVQLVSTAVADPLDGAVALAGVEAS